MKEVLLVFIGGGLGSMVRYGLSRAINYITVSTFPVATLFINILACFVLGLFLSYLDLKNSTNPSLRLLVATGFCGGFSTFSTFSYETLSLLRSGQATLALANIFLSVILCLAATLSGLLLAKILLPR